MGRADASGHIVVQFAGPVDQVTRRQLADAGLKLQGYLGEHAYFAAFSSVPPGKNVLAAAGLVRVETIRPEWKLHPLLADGQIPDYARVPAPAPGEKARPAEAGVLAQAGRIAVYVLFHADIPLQPEGMNIARGHGAAVRDQIESVHGLVIELPPQNIAALAAEDAVQWIEPPLPRMGPVNDGARWITGAEVVHGPPGPGDLIGREVKVLLYDAGTADPRHVDFGGRVRVRDASGYSDHAQHVAGTIAGDGTASGGRYRGLAPGATIESMGFEYDGSGIFLYSNPGDLEADYRAAVRTFGAVLANNSIGSNISRNGFPCGLLGDYGVTSALIDGLVVGRLGTPISIVWANGNERASTRCSSGYASIAPPAAAKNPILVGAVNSNDDSMTGFSSWGPTDDGRLRPDLCAPGCQTGGDRGITSTVGTGSYAAFCGTSMAAPAVTGACALLIEQWQRLYGTSSQPRNATLKAALVHTAVDLGTPGPDYATGYGSVRVDRAVELLRAGGPIEDVLDQGDTRTYVVILPDHAPELRVTLAWDDPPGTPNVIPQLVNDLDLVAIAPDGRTVHYPWTLDPGNPARPAVQTFPDRLNNIEQIRVSDPAAGTWVVRVRGHAVAQGPQPFSLTATPALRTCSPAGTIAWNAESYRCNAVARLTVSDCDANRDLAVPESVEALVQTEGAPPEVFVLHETGPDTGIFAADLRLADTPGEGDILVQDAASLAAWYTDEDAGGGGPRVLEARAVTDCRSPTILETTVIELTALRATLRIRTDEPVLARIRHGDDCRNLEHTTVSAGLAAEHRITLTGLRPGRNYRYSVEVEDAVGNIARTGGPDSCLTLTTPPAPDHYTRQFLRGAAELAGRSILWIPDGSISFYRACPEAVDELPVSPEGGHWVRNNTEVVLPAGRRVSLYNRNYSRFWINGSGTITFGSWDYADINTIANHFALPRISVLFNWYYPSEAGRISWKLLEDRVAVTWELVRDAGTGQPNTFQAELFDDGRLRLTWLLVQADDPVVGLSRGGGIPPDFLESDLPDYAPCGHGSLRLAPTGPLTCGMVAGLPIHPCARGYELVNADSNALHWTAASGCPWVNVTPAEGTLAPGESMNVEVALNTAAAGRPPAAAVYVCPVTFTSEGQSPVTREVHLTVTDSTPPQALDRLAITATDTPVEITLLALDDGSPAPPGALSYRVVSSPSHGRLTGVEGSPNRHYVPDPGFVGVDRFQYVADDGGVPPAGGSSMIATVRIRVLAPPTIPANPHPPDGVEVPPWTLSELGFASSDPTLRRVAVVAAAHPWGITDPHFTDTRDLLAGSGLFESVAVIDAGRVTPTLAELQAYDAVITWSNDQYADPAALGDALADYVDRGGGVVVAIFANVTVRSYGNLLGRFVTDNYFCIDYPGSPVWAALLDRPAQQLDRVLEPRHPVMAGVRRLDGGERSFRLRSSYPGEGALFLATWTDGAPLAAWREVAGTPRVDLAMYPPSDAVNAEFWDRTTDGGRLMANALAATTARSGAATTWDILLDTVHPPRSVLCRGSLYPSCPVPDRLEPGTTYYWQAIARNHAGTTASPVWSFRTPPAATTATTDSLGDPDDGLADFGIVARGETATAEVEVCNADPTVPAVLHAADCQPRDLFADGFERQELGPWAPAQPLWWGIVGSELAASAARGSARMQCTFRPDLASGPEITPLQATGTLSTDDRDGRWTDLSAGVSLRRLGSMNTFAGLAVRATEDFDWATGRGSAYLIGISATAQFYVGRQFEGSFAFLREWSRNSRLKTLLGTNRIDVNLVGTRIEVYLNGRLAWAGEDASIAGPGRVALLGYSDEGSLRTTHLFDDFRVGRPMPAVEPSIAAQTRALGASVVPGGTALWAAEEDPAVSHALWSAQAMGPDVPIPDPCRDFSISLPRSLPLTLTPGECAAVRATFSPQGPGLREATLRLAVGDPAKATHRVHLLGQGGPARLLVEPPEQTLSGPESGPWPVPCATFSLTNRSAEAIDWSAQTDVDWLAFPTDRGRLTAGELLEVHACLAPTAGNLPPGTHKARVVFTDLGSGLGQTAILTLDICRLPPAPAAPSPPDGAADQPPVPELAWNVGLPVPRSCTRLGNAAIGYQGRNLMLATIVSVSRPQMLHSFGIRLSFQGPAELDFMVLSADNPAGPFTLQLRRRSTVAGTGTAYYGSPTLFVPLEPGHYYAVGAAWRQPLVGYASEYVPQPLDWAAGRSWGLVWAYCADDGELRLPGTTAVAIVPVELCLNPAGQVRYDVLLRPAGGPARPVGLGLPAPFCRIEEPLTPGTIYHWQVVAHNDCGRRPGPMWSFATRTCPQGPPTVDWNASPGPRLRRTHGPAGDLDLPLTLSPPAVECRTGAPVTLLVPFDRPVLGQGGLDASDIACTVDGVPFGDILGVSRVGRELAVAFSDLPAGLIRVRFPGLIAEDDPTCPVEETLSFLVWPGDVNADRTVNLLDLIPVRNALGRTADPSILRRDVNVNGHIDLLDLLAVRDRLEPGTGARYP